MRLSWFFKFLIFVFAILIVFVAYFVYNFQSINKKPFSSNVEIEVSEGDTLNNVLTNLSNTKQLRNELFVKLSVKMFNYDTNIKPGNYYFDETTSLGAFIYELNQGIVSNDYIRITIPEGYSIESMANVFGNSELNFTKEEFIEAVKNYSLPSYVKKVSGRRYALEGFLFPDTYHFDRDSTPEIVIDTMIKRFEEILNEIQKELNVVVENDKIDEIVTMASIVEREIIHDEERPKAASVFYNRLRIDMLLQSCATVIYSLGYHKEVLYNSDLEVDSQYNTYRYSGLPIGPIASPGKQSIKASINPDSTEYLYFILNDETNYHYFFDNYRDFLRQKDIRDTTLFVKQ